MIRLFVCIECQHIFDEDEVATWKEDRGECWGSPCYEKVSGCPKCHGSYVKAYQCDSCGEWINDTYVITDDDKKYCCDCYRVVELGDK